MAIVPLTFTAKTEQEQTEIATAICENAGLPVTLENVRKLTIAFFQQELRTYQARTSPKTTLQME